MTGYLNKYYVILSFQKLFAPLMLRLFIYKNLLGGVTFLLLSEQKSLETPFPVSHLYAFMRVTSGQCFSRNGLALKDQRPEMQKEIKFKMNGFSRSFFHLLANLPSFPLAAVFTLYYFFSYMDTSCWGRYWYLIRGVWVFML